MWRGQTDRRCGDVKPSEENTIYTRFQTARLQKAANRLWSLNKFTPTCQLERFPKPVTSENRQRRHLDLNWTDFSAFQAELAVCLFFFTSSLQQIVTINVGAESVWGL